MTPNVARFKLQLRIPESEHLFAAIVDNAAYAKRMATHNSRVGKRVVICGAGPSLAEHCDSMPLADEVWACNSALSYLMARGVPVTHGFAIDQGEAMLADHEFGLAHDVKYYLASSVHPLLVERLYLAGRDLTFFHSHLGVPSPKGWEPPVTGLTYEEWLYTNRELYADSIRVNHGLNSAVRAVCLALAMGFEHITVIGADCAARPNAGKMPALDDAGYPGWLQSLDFYADGRTGGSWGSEERMVEAVLDGVRWHTRPDMAISARHLMELKLVRPDHITIMGNVLPNVFLAHADDPDWIAALPSINSLGQVENLTPNVTPALVLRGAS